MICGFFNKLDGDSARPEIIDRMLAVDGQQRRVDKIVMGPAALASVKERSQSQDITSYQPSLDTVDTKKLVWTGEIYNRNELMKSLGFRSDSEHFIDDTAVFLKGMENQGRSFIERINGRFAFAAYDKNEQEVLIGRDHLGLETLYYYDDPRIFVFGSRIAPILAHPGVYKTLNLNAFRRFLVFNYNPAWDTFFQGVWKVRPGSLIALRADALIEKRYWFLSFKADHSKGIDEFSHELRELMRDSIRLRSNGDDPLGIFLSGGMDSSSVAGLTKEVSRRPIESFSYRCFGDSYDEAEYARIMARFCDANHNEVVYRPADVCQMVSIVKLMDEPLCNVGIIIPTYLLAHVAQEKVDNIFSGDGGDELFGGHPVYTADKIAGIFERFPSIVRTPLTLSLQKLPDSDKKLSLTVKLKRFSESINQPQELGTNRWRVYYSHDTLNQLLGDDFRVTKDEWKDLFRDVIEVTHEADGADILSRSLFADFQTELSFSLRRMDLLKHFQIRPRFPLLDYRLVEYSATIPSNLKIRGFSDSKYIQRKAMEGLLPDEIVFREDKLGHSIPFKNWLRQEPTLKQFVQNYLSSDRLAQRGLIDEDYVQQLWEDHQSQRRNNSHRLWTLTVLELWLSANGF